MNRFVIVYQGSGEPAPHEEAELVNALKSAQVIDCLPGLLLVEGSQAEVAAAVGHCKNWTFTTECSVGVAPPHKKLKSSD